MKRRFLSALLALILTFSLILTGCDFTFGEGVVPDSTPQTNLTPPESPENPENPSPEGPDDEYEAPTLTPEPGVYEEVNGNIPYFTEGEITTESFERYSARDPLGRCGVAFACIGIDLMPTELRDFSLASISPSGWETNGKSNNNVYSTSIVPNGYIYNRCHLIGYQLTGETTNKDNLITGTKQLNSYAMLPVENMIADFIKDTGYHVMYRVTPVFEDSNLLASGVLLEAYSVEDEGEGICMCIYIYNAQPGIEINYLTGENKLADSEDNTDEDDGTVKSFIINISSGKIHTSGCKSAPKPDSVNYEAFEGTLTELKEKYPSPEHSPCGNCKPFN